jgi:type I restriction enzyme R subunit
VPRKPKPGDSGSRTPPDTPSSEAEWRTRKSRIDPRLKDAGWALPPKGTTPLHEPHRTEEEETDNGPADYALWDDRKVIGIVEAKKVRVGAYEVLRQAERYARGLRHSPFTFGEYRCPFVYATNGEIIWFRDVRDALNLSREVAAFHTPAALREMLDRDFDDACGRLRALSNEHNLLRPYQREANAAVEQAIAERKRRLLVAMATGTGKTYTFVNQIYRLMKAGVAKRVLFLVDRRALAAQAVRAFASFEAEPGQKFDKIYEVYSSRFQTEDFGEEEKFDPKIMPRSYLEDPKPSDAFVFVATIQRMAINVLGRQAIFGIGDEEIEDDADRLNIPIHAFDVIIADECHRGYTAAEQSVWRSTLNHFDAIKIGLTATPAAHTTSYFTHLAYRYDYAQAVKDGYLVDYDVVNIRSNVRMKGVFLAEGEDVEVVDPETGLTRMDRLEEERGFDASEIERRITAPDSNRKIIEEVKRYALDHEREYGRFPKTLIFAVNDLPHVSHADQLVAVCREAFERGEAFAAKITGRVDRPLQRIREFRNRPTPAIAVTVDLLTTGVDIPDLEFIVFLRPVKSRILFEQMLGRGTRKGDTIHKSHFTVFDCFDGTLLEYFRKATDITAEPLDQPTRTLAEVIEAIWNNRDREYNTRILVKRLHRVDKQMSAKAREQFAAFIPHGDMAAYARGLASALHKDFPSEMARLRDSAFQDLLVNYDRARDTFVRAINIEDVVTSERRIHDRAGKEWKPEDYLEAFARYVREHRHEIDAIRILLDRPREWSATALSELRQKLAVTPEEFTEDNLRLAHEVRYQRALVDIISMVKHAADQAAPLLTASERVERALAKVTAGKTFSPEQQQWLGRIAAHLRQNLSIEQSDFDWVPALSRPGGFAAARHVFGARLEPLITELNEAIAA